MINNTFIQVFVGTLDLDGLIELVKIIGIRAQEIAEEHERRKREGAANGDAPPESPSAKRKKS